MALRCPVCKAENAQGPNCRRCKADLSMMFALEDQRAPVMEEARLPGRGALERSAHAGAALRTICGRTRNRSGCWR